MDSTRVTSIRAGLSMPNSIPRSVRASGRCRNPSRRAPDRPVDEQSRCRTALSRRPQGAGADRRRVKPAADEGPPGGQRRRVKRDGRHAREVCSLTEEVLHRASSPGSLQFTRRAIERTAGRLSLMTSASGRPRPRGSTNGLIRGQPQVDCTAGRAPFGRGPRTRSPDRWLGRT